MNSEVAKANRLEKIGRINEIKELLERDENIISYLTENHRNATSVEDEMISYDLRAGQDIKNYNDNPELYNRIADKIFSYIVSIGANDGRILECGSGEGIVLSEICANESCEFSWARGIDISWSRTAYAKKYIKNRNYMNCDIDFFVADFFHLPVKSNSIDVVYTMQGIYGMGGYEEPLLRELYRCTNKYLILIEPCYELAEEQAKARMDKLGYVKNLKGTAEALGYNIIMYEMFGLDANPLNPAAVLIIEKKAIDLEKNDNAICCPFSYGDIVKIGNAYYCDESKLSYPILNGVACLTRENAIVSSKILDFDNSIM